MIYICVILIFIALYLLGKQIEGEMDEDSPYVIFYVMISAGLFLPLGAIVILLLLPY